MKTHLLPTVGALVGLLVLAVGPMAVQAQTTNAPTTNAPTTNSITGPPPDRFDVEIREGRLRLTPLEGRVDIRRHLPDASPVNDKIRDEQFLAAPATLRNLVRYLEALNPNLNIVLARDAESVQIANLKMRSASISELGQALGYATDGQVRVTGFGPGNWSFAAKPGRTAERSVEVFNITGFIQQLPKEESAIPENLKEIERLILQTLHQLESRQSQTEPWPELSFHQGTGLFIVTGSPAALEVSRKIINALPGQPQQGSARADLLEPSRRTSEE